MATVNCGILDGFYGKVGTVVGSFWKGIPVMRAYVRRQHDAKSETQVVIRARFKAMMELVSGFLDASRIGLHDAAAAGPMTEGNMFFVKNWDMVTASGVESVSVDFTGLTVAQGHLPGVHFNAPQFDTPLQVDVDFDDNMEYRGTSPDDEVYVFVYCPDAKCGVLSAPAKRSDESVSVKVPSYWNGMKVHVYGFAKGALDSGRYGQCSDSAYLGTGNIG